MLREIRKHIARLISSIDLPNTFIMNVRLQHPPNKLKEIELFSLFIKDTSDIDLHCKASEIEYIFYFAEGTKQNITEYVYFDKIRTKPHFFYIALPKIENNEFHQITAEYYNFENCTIPNVEIRNINLVDRQVTTVNYEFLFNAPTTKNYLTNFIPSIQKIDLLDNCNLAVPSLINNNINEPFSPTMEACTIRKINRLAFSTDTPILSYTDFNINRQKIFSISTSEIIAFNEINIENIQTKNLFKTNSKIVHDNLIENYTEIADQKNLFELLYAKERIMEMPANIPIPIVKESPPKEIIHNNILLRNPEPESKLHAIPTKIKIQSDMPAYLKEGIEFLLNNKLALFCDEFELDKEYQAIIALNNLIKDKIIKKVLIITEPYKSRFIDLNCKCIANGLWQSNITRYAQNIDFRFYETPEIINSAEELKQNTITVLTYEVYEKCLNEGILNGEKLHHYDCIIFDDISKTTFQNESINHLTGKIDRCYLWFFSDFDQTSVSDNIIKLFPNKTVSIFGRKKKSLGNETIDAHSYNIFLELDEQNIFLADRIYNDGRKKLEELLIGGNLSRIIPNAAQTVQEMQRLTNFILGTHSGNKTNLLRYHLDRILDGNNRVLIYSQFDALGLSKIQEILQEINIKFIKVSLTDSPHDIQKKLNSINNTNEKLVYLANINPKTSKLDFPGISHLINFDNWWNPVTRKTIGEKLLSNNKEITIYNYFYKDTLESQLYNEMSSIGITDKSLPANITAEKFNQIFDEKSWCRIFNLSDDFSSYGKVDETSEIIAEPHTEE